MINPAPELVSRPLSPVKGIGPGSPFATYELMVLVIQDLRDLQSRHLEVRFSLHVDDLHGSTAQYNDQTAINTTQAAAFDAIVSLEEGLGLPFDAKKAQVVSSSKAVAEAAAKALGGWIFKLLKHRFELSLVSPRRQTRIWFLWKELVRNLVPVVEKH